MVRARVYRRIVVRCRLRRSLSRLRFQLDAQGRVFWWEAALLLRGPEGSYRHPGVAAKERALAMYTEGSSLSAIGRVLGYSAQAVSQWVKRGAGSLDPVAAAGPRAD